jgi:hypothetical protein
VSPVSNALGVILAVVLVAIIILAALAPFTLAKHLPPPEAEEGEKR